MALFRRVLPILLAASMVASAAMAQQLAPMLDSDEGAKIEQKYPNKSLYGAPGEGEEKPSGDGFSAQEGSDGSVTLKSTVKTLDVALKEEMGKVDWYGWYLAARNYIAHNGFINCPLGTPIKFYRDGRIEPMSFSAPCVASTMNMNFPLPKNTSVDVIILPTRPSVIPPASPQELYDFLRQSDDTRYD